MTRRLPVLLALALAPALALGAVIVPAAGHNRANLALVHAWQATIYQGPRDDDLQDGIPDGWQPYSWDGATQIYAVDAGAARAGARAARVERTSAAGVAALGQDIAVEPAGLLTIRVHARGAGGALQVLLRAPGEAWALDGPVGWLAIPASEVWRAYTLTLEVPPGRQAARVLLRSAGATWFDDVYAGQAPGAANLLANAGFEQDGSGEDPLLWWRRTVRPLAGAPELPDAAVRNAAVTNAAATNAAYANIADMLAGRVEAIQARARALGADCARHPEMTGWLIARGPEFARAGGAAAEERLYQLGRALAPDCPQPYAALARLYAARGAGAPAAALFHQAALRAPDPDWAGLYYFAEGELALHATGALPQAIAALGAAEQRPGWEPSGWYLGAAALYLGNALEAAGRSAEAAAAYRRVLACSACELHHRAAEARLRWLADQPDGR